MKTIKLSYLLIYDEILDNISIFANFEEKRAFELNIQYYSTRQMKRSHKSMTDSGEMITSEV